jgi:hypothetical protein
MDNDIGYQREILSCEYAKVCALDAVSRNPCQIRLKIEEVMSKYAKI